MKRKQERGEMAWVKGSWLLFMANQSATEKKSVHMNFKFY